MADTARTQTLRDRLARLPTADRTLLLSMAAMALATLTAGIAAGAVTGFLRAGFAEVHPETGYRLMTLHGVGAFFYWLYFGQAMALLALAAAAPEGRGRLAARPVGWLGFGAMTAGFVASVAGTLMGAPLLYDGSPELVGDERVGAGLFYLGYLLLSVGLLLIAVAAIATPLAAVSDGRIEEWSAATFATVAWAGLLAVSAAAAVYAFLPPALWVAGLAAEPADHANNWHLLFHNLHYLPLMGTILIWYVLAESLIGMRSIYGTRYSKVVFASYLIFVPPTSLYHMFLEPGLTATVRVMGSLLSLFVGVPTILAFLIIVMSLEATARAAGARGAFGWLRALPWRDPVMSAMGMAAFNLAFGGVFAFVLIQEQLAPLLSDTFFVPAYFHFLTAGTVTLTLLAALAYAMPALSGRSLPWRRLSVALPYTATAGILIFAFAGLIAGFQGIPRRTLDVGYEGSAAPGWTIWLGLIGAGAAVMAASLLGYAAVLAAILFGRRRTPSDVPVVAVPRSVDLGRPLGSAWSAPVSILVLLFGMYAATAAAFIVMRGLPLVAAGGSAH